MKKKGTCEMIFSGDAKMNEKFKLEKAKKFIAHSELDVFVGELIKKDPRFEFNYPMEWILLKSFDRAFW